MPASDTRRSLNVATPNPLVAAVNVPARMPVLPFGTRARVTNAPETLAPEFVTRTLTAPSGVPAGAFPGWPVKATTYVPVGTGGSFAGIGSGSRVTSLFGSKTSGS